MRLQEFGEPLDTQLDVDPDGYLAIACGEEIERRKAVVLEPGHLVLGAVHLGDHDALDLGEPHTELQILGLELLAVAAPWREDLEQHVKTTHIDERVEGVSDHEGDWAVIDLRQRLTLAHRRRLALEHRVNETVKVLLERCTGRPRRRWRAALGRRVAHLGLEVQPQVDAVKGQPVRRGDLRLVHAKQLQQAIGRIRMHVDEDDEALPHMST